MVEPVAVAAAGLMAAGVLGSVLPAVPSGLLSLAGLYAYVLLGAEPIGVPLLAGLTLLGGLAAVADQFAGPLAARATGASTRTALAAAVGGLAGLLVLGPVGLPVGTVAVVSALELRRGAAPRAALRRAAGTALGVLLSSGIQALLAAAVLGAFLLAVVA